MLSLTTVYFILFTVTSIRFWSKTVTFKEYIFDTPVSLITVISKVLSPSLTSFSPVPLIDAYESSLLALIVILLTVEGTFTEYSLVFFFFAGLIW